MSNKEQMQELNDKLNQNMMELNSIVNVIAQLPPKQTPETLTITPTKNKQTSRGLYNVVTVNEIPDEYIIPNGTKEITENGTYDIKEYETATVNIASSGGGSIEVLVEKDVNFYTPYGDLVASYTIAEANALTELPQAPELPRLTFEEWNYDLADIQATTTPLDVGGTYTTTSGACEFDVDVNSKSGMTVSFYAPKGITSIDWGDGTIDTNLSHTYTTTGQYTILAYGLTSFGDNIMNSGVSSTGTWNYNLKEVRIGSGVVVMNSYAFQCCQSLKYITLPTSLISYNSSSPFRYSYSLEFYVFPKGTKSIDATYMFSRCYGLRGVSIPINLITYKNYMFERCHSLKRVILSKKSTSLYDYMFTDCYDLEKVIIGNINSLPYTLSGNYSLQEIDLTNCTSIPTLSSTNNLNSVNYTCKIKVPANLYESFKTASNWSTYKEYFVAI